MSVNLKLRALLIGINYIGSRNELKGCINDVNNSLDFIIKKYGFQKENIRILTDNTAIRPTKDNIITGMKWLVDGNDEHSRLFLHYSGHGSYMKDTDNNEPSGYDQLICPVDLEQNGFITDDTMKTILVDSLHEQAKLTVLFDDCHSGTALDLRYNFKVNVLTPERFSYSTCVINAFDSKSKGNAILFAGCRDEETSADAFINGKSQGAMTFSFLQAFTELEKTGKPITYKKMLKCIQSTLKNNGYSQDIQLSFANKTDINSVFTLL